MDPLLQFETQLEIIQSSFKMVFAIPSLEEMKEVGNSTEEDEEDLTVRFRFLSPRGDVAAMLGKVSPQVMTFVVFSLPLCRYQRCMYVPALIYTPGLLVNSTTHGIEGTV